MNNEKNFYSELAAVVNKQLLVYTWELKILFICLSGWGKSRGKMDLKSTTGGGGSAQSDAQHNPVVQPSGTFSHWQSRFPSIHLSDMTDLSGLLD